MNESTKNAIAKDIGIIKKVDNKIQYKNIQQVVSVYNLLCEKNSLKTSYGKKYLAYLESTILGESIDSCLICAARCSANSVFCSSCLGKLSNGGKTHSKENNNALDRESKSEVKKAPRAKTESEPKGTKPDNVEESTFFANEYYKKQNANQANKNKQPFDEEFIDEEVTRNNSKRRKVIFFLIPGGLFLLWMGEFLYVDEKDYSMGIFALVSGVVCILWGLIWYTLERIRQKKGSKYIPYKGYFIYRMTSAERIKFVKRMKLIKNVLAILIAILFISEGTFSSFLSLASGFLMATAALSALGNRIKYHVDIDDATYFELEELGLITESDVVLSLYKDFESWKTIRPNSKVLVLCQDTLSVLSFADSKHARKIKIPLKQIDRLRIASGSMTKYTASKQTKKGVKQEEVSTGLAGMIITIGLNGNCIKFYLRGESCMDSPEEFFSLFLRELDKKLTNKKKEHLYRPSRVVAHADTIFEESNEIIRNITITDEKIDTGIGGYEDNTPRRNISF